MSAFGIPSAVRLASRGYRLPALARAGVVLGGLVAAVPALAAVGDRIPFQEFTSKACRNTAICSANFEVVPANSRIEVNSVSCFLFRGQNPPDTISGGLGQGIASLEFAVLNAAGEIIMHDYAVTRDSGVRGSGANDFGWFLEANHNTYFLVPPGGRVQAVMVSTKAKRNLGLDCKIAGEQVIVR